MLATVADFAAALDRVCPPELDEPWDNTGLLWGDAAWPVPSATTCLTLTPDVAAEAVRRGDGLVVTHHPVLFRKVQGVTAGDPQGRMLLELAAAKVAVLSPHARWDNAPGGINDLLCERFALSHVRPLRPLGEGPHGSGRVGRLVEPVSFADFAARCRDALDLPGLEAVPTGRSVRRVGVACGSAGESLADAAAAGCDAFVTGEARFHTALEARGAGVGLVLPGHYASERFSLRALADRLAEEVPGVPVRESEVERDPLVRM